MKSGIINRKYWVDMITKISYPVLYWASKDQLKQKMPKVNGNKYMYLEAIGRTLVGIAPWLETQCIDNAEEEKRKEFASMARKAIDNITNPDAKDYAEFAEDKIHSQYLVDTAFLANAIIRAKGELFDKLPDEVKKNVIRTLKSSRKFIPYHNNWLLFSAMVEVALCSIGEEFDLMRIDYAVSQHEQWYKGDGVYGDGKDFHFDYYNSFVIHPFLVDIIEIVQPYWSETNMKTKIEKRSVRFSEILERFIAPDGTYPIVGRSIAYRCGVFHCLSQAALKGMLTISPAQARCALTAVIKRCMEHENTFDKDGWLTIGVAGNQPSISERYINNGSVYLCTTAFLPLGLSEKDAFWDSDDMPWTSKKVWNGEDLAADHCLCE